MNALAHRSGGQHFGCERKAGGKFLIWWFVGHPGIGRRAGFSRRTKVVREESARRFCAKHKVPFPEGGRCIATFTPEAWINDYAREVDPLGDTSIDITKEVMRLGREKALKLRDNDNNSDYLKDLPNAPKWIRDWSGPFYIRLESAVAAFFEAEAAAKP